MVQKQNYGAEIVAQTVQKRKTNGTDNVLHAKKKIGLMCQVCVCM